ncbi:MAG: hypothetical protein HQK81_15495 [Desulfovibrionaceae bacterium]|nr:hypothetical protein [Desulfovibrionaceae bacterium]MBF0515446.1 hypothetical protein [Desulfovibrionaceae bacterium]
MKFFMSAILVVCALFLASLAFTGTDDMKWIAKCVSDNADAKVASEVVTKYCTCMNNKMGDNETLSISAWEKTHQAEMKECEKEAGWK